MPTESADLPDIEEKKWHSLSIDETMEILSASEDGLSDEEAEKRKQKYGLNKLPEPGSRSAWMRFFLQFKNVLIYVLLGAAVITALLEHWIDTWVILGVVVINAVIGFIQEGKAEQALDEIKKMLSLSAAVKRSGRQRDRDAEELVPGDIVLLESGDKVPADIRLIYTRSFRIEESALTGESAAVDKNTEPVEEDAVPGDQTCMAFSGTSVVHGRATGVVAATGAHTELGKINRMMSEVKQLTTPLLNKIDEFATFLAKIILGVTVLFFGIGYLFHDYTIDELFLAVISLAVAAIPEGLPPLMTITLAVGVRAMAGRNAIIRRLPSVETLGAVTVICSDKTGTLTKNEMTVRSVSTATGNFEVKGTGYAPEGSILQDNDEINPEDHNSLFELAKAVRACNDAEIYQSEEGSWHTDGDPTDAAVLVFGYKAGLESFTPERIDNIPFESEQQYMATLNRVDGQSLIYMKGAPEKLFELCSHQRTKDGRQKLDPEYWKAEMEKMAEQGQRVIAAAARKADDGQNDLNPEDLTGEMEFLGLIGIIDPPRPEAIEAIKQCKKAGIIVKMITGDHLTTAKSIGRELGIGDGEKAIKGSDLQKMDEDELRKAAREYDVFARTSPEHKLRLVKGLQAEGMICGMTGDGVNDAPALKRADIGIAMGIKGTEVTKDASEMVLADDNFASIANAVEEGRTIYDNLKKAILFLLPTSGAESLVVMAAIIAGITLPITPVQILWINMVTAVTLGLALAFESTEPGTMSLPPRHPDAPILDRYLVWRICFVSLLIGSLTLGIYFLLYNNDIEVNIARTVAVNTLAAGELFYLFNCRRIHQPALSAGFLENKAAFWASGILVVLQLVFTYAPFMNAWFGSAPHGLFYWAYPVAGGVVVFCLVELEKYLFGGKVEEKESEGHGENAVVKE
ncbi:MAG: cation-transporting P-type ATPase [Balneolaceae bacterium]